MKNWERWVTGHQRAIERERERGREKGTHTYAYLRFEKGRGGDMESSIFPSSRVARIYTNTCTCTGNTRILLIWSCVCPYGSTHAVDCRNIQIIVSTQSSCIHARTTLHNLKRRQPYQKNWNTTRANVHAHNQGFTGITCTTNALWNIAACSNATVLLQGWACCTRPHPGNHTQGQAGWWKRSQERAWLRSKGWAGKSGAEWTVRLPSSRACVLACRVKHTSHARMCTHAPTRPPTQRSLAHPRAHTAQVSHRIGTRENISR